MKRRIFQLTAIFIWAAATTAAAFPPLDDRFEIKFRVDRSQPVTQVYLYLQRKAKNACRNPGMWHPLHKMERKQCAGNVLDRVVTLLDWAALTELHDRTVRAEGPPQVIAKTR